MGQSRRVFLIDAVSSFCIVHLLVRRSRRGPKITEEPKDDSPEALTIFHKDAWLRAGRGMKARRRWVLVTAMAAATTLVLWEILRPREPVYQGKPVSYWLDLGVEGFAHPPSAMPGKRPEGPSNAAGARDALSAIGPAALPYLAARMDAPMSGWQRWYRTMLMKLPRHCKARARGHRRNARRR